MMIKKVMMAISSHNKTDSWSNNHHQTDSWSNYNTGINSSRTNFHSKKSNSNDSNKETSSLVKKRFQRINSNVSTITKLTIIRHNDNRWLDNYFNNRSSH